MLHNLHKCLLTFPKFKNVSYFLQYVALCNEVIKGMLRVHLLCKLVTLANEKRTLLLNVSNQIVFHIFEDLLWCFIEIRESERYINVFCEKFRKFFRKSESFNGHFESFSENMP